MSYNKPAAQVYQQLINAGGAASINPDLPACIVGDANNVVTIDFNSSIAKARSLAGTLDTINDGTQDWEISVTSASAFAGQTIADASVTATFEDALVRTYEEDVVSFASGTGTLTIADNVVGNSPSNAATHRLPWVANVNHVNIGDLAIIDDVITFVTAVSDTQLSVAAIIADGDHKVTIYHKFSTSVARVDWDGDKDVLRVGSIAAKTFPNGFTPTDANTNDGYTYAVEKELKGYGSPAKVYIGYKAARNDLSASILTIADATDLTNKLGQADPTDNPLAFGVSIALANSGGAPVLAIALDQSAASDAIAHSKALSLAEGRLIYWMVPLTQDTSIHAMYKAHAAAMSLPTASKWRTALVNQAIPVDFYVIGRPDGGDADSDALPDNLLEATASSATVQLASGDVGKTKAGDTLVVYTTAAPTPVEYTVDAASGSLITCTAPVAVSGQVFVYVKRTASRQEQAQAIADQSKTWGERHVWNFPGDVRVNTDVVGETVPGYFLMCAVAGLGSGLPAQHGMTNITIAGVAGLQHANFYFSDSQLNLMAEFGTMLFVQASQETTPYCRHGLTTDVSVLAYREGLKVKNIDYLSYYFKSIVDPFIGTWNITPDTIQTIRQTLTSSAERLKSRKLPKIGAPLLGYKISKIAQNENSADSIDIVMEVATVSPNNYTNIYLQI